MSLVDFVSNFSRRNVIQPMSVATVAVKETVATVANTIRRNWAMDLKTIDEKLKEARAAEAAAEVAHGQAAVDYATGQAEDDRAIGKRRKELVAAKEKVEDLLAARAAAVMNQTESEADAKARAEAAWAEKLGEAIDELVPLAQKVEDKLDELAAALSALWAGEAAIGAMGKRARPAHVAVLHSFGGIPTLAWHRLHKLGIVPENANYMLSEAEVGLVRRLPDPATMIRMCPVPPPAASGKGGGAGSYAVPKSEAVISVGVLN